ncbi:MAG: hypothetical protein ACOVNL_01805 [Prochlorococcaceae cyanobacterium]|jgi:hypothetical protein
MEDLPACIPLTVERPPAGAVPLPPADAAVRGKLRRGGESADFPGLCLLPGQDEAASEPFLLLPGDGLLLLGWAPMASRDPQQLRLLHLDRDARRLLGPDLEPPLEAPLAAFWPALAALLVDVLPRLEQEALWI